MQRSSVSPGLAVGMSYAAWVASLSLTVTSPAVTALLSLLVVFEKAENAPEPATTPARPSTAAERSVLRRRFIGGFQRFCVRLDWRPVSVPYDEAFSPSRRAGHDVPPCRRKETRARTCTQAADGSAPAHRSARTDRRLRGACLRRPAGGERARHGRLRQRRARRLARRR